MGEPCNHTNEQLQYTGDGVEVALCLDCGQNRLTGNGEVMTNQAKSADIVEELRLLADGMAARHGIENDRLFSALSDGADFIEAQATELATLRERVAELEASFISERQDNAARYSEAMNQCNRYDLENATLRAHAEAMAMALEVAMDGDIDVSGTALIYGKDCVHLKPLWNTVFTAYQESRNVG